VSRGLERQYRADPGRRVDPPPGDVGPRNALGLVALPGDDAASWSHEQEAPSLFRDAASTDPLKDLLPVLQVRPHAFEHLFFPLLGNEVKKSHGPRPRLEEYVCEAYGIGAPKQERRSNHRSRKERS